jgi:CRISPR-associated protein Csb2
MLTVAVTLLHGTIRAASADDLVLAGGDDPGDWPPNSARLVAAFVAADRTRARCRVTDGSELSLFEEAPPPRIYASPRSLTARSRLRARFVVDNVSDGRGAVQDYPFRTASLVRPGTRLSPRDARIVYIWDDVDATAAELSALRLRAARIGYLGCADSPVHVSVSNTFDPAAAPSTVWEPDAAGDVEVPTPFSGLVDILDAAFDQWSEGTPVRRVQFRTERTRYRSPDRPRHAPAPAAPSVIWLRFARPVSGRRALSLAETLKRAVLERYDRDVAGTGGDVPAVLHGHGFDGRDGYQLAQWLVLPNVGFRYSTGRLHGAAVMLPAGTDAVIVESVRAALWRITELVVPGLRPIGVRPFQGERTPMAATPGRWQGPARRWISALPVVYERRQRGAPSLDDVSTWCRHAGVPEPLSVRLSPTPLVAGGLTLHPSEVFRDRPGSRRPYSHLEIVFAEPVTGPIVLGRARQFGMGLMAPME